MLSSPTFLSHQSLKPHAQSLLCLLAIQPFELSKVEGLLANLHLRVKSSLLREVADVLQILAGEGMSCKGDLPLIRHGKSGQHADEGSLPGTIGSKKTMDLTTLNSQAGVIKSSMCGEILDDVSRLK